MTWANRITPRETEAEFQGRVVDLALWNKWRVYHTRDSRGSNPGFPDLVLVRPTRTVFAELKAEHGRLSADQAAWLRDLRDAGEEAYLWRPSDFTEIVRLLDRRQKTRPQGGETHGG